MQQQRALAAGADAGDLVERVLDHLLLAPRAVRADGEAVRLVAQPLDEIEHRIAHRQRERVPALDEEALAAGVAVLALGDADRHDAVLDAEIGEDLAHRRHLALAAVDQDDVGPGRKAPMSLDVVVRSPSASPASAHRHAP